MTLHLRTSTRSRNKKSSCRSYRKVLWFRPCLEPLEDRTLLSGYQPADVLSAFNSGANALAGQSANIGGQALELTIPLVSQSDKLGSDLVGVANDVQIPFNTNNLSANNWQSQLTGAGFKIDESPVVNSDETWSPNADGNFLEAAWSQTFSLPAVLVASSTGFSYLDSTGGLFGAINASASVKFTVTMGVDDAGTNGAPDFFVLASSAGNATVPGTALTATLAASSSNSLSGTLNIPGGLGNVSASAGPTLNITADGEFNTTANDSNGKVRLADFQNALSSVIRAGFDPSSSAQLNVSLNASLLGRNVQWKATGGYNLNSNDTGWSPGSFTVDSSSVDPASLLKSIGSQFFSLGDGIPILGPLSSELNQPLPLINQSIAQLTGLDKDLPQLPSLPGNLNDGTYTLSLAGGTLSVNVTPAAIQALLDPQSGQTVNLISWTTGPQSVSLVNSSVDVPIFALGIPDIADVELDAHFGVDASLNYDLGFGIDNHGFYFLAGNSSNPTVGLTFSVNAGLTGSVKILGFPLASAGGNVGFAISPYVTLTPPPNNGWDKGYYDSHKVYLSDLGDAFGSNPLIDLADDISAGIKGDLTGTLSVSVNLLFTSLSKSWGLDFPVFNYETGPTWPPPPPPPGPLGSQAPGDSTKWQQVVTPPINGVLTFDDTLSSNKGDTISLSENAPGSVTIAWAGAGSKTYTGITQFNFIAANASGNNHLLVSSGFNIPIHADDSASSGSDLLESGPGNDTLIGGSGSDTFIAGSGNDSITSGDGNDVIVGGKGRDTLVAGDGNDTISGGSGSSTITAGTGTDSIYTGSGNDVVSVAGGSSNDTIVAGSGNDSLNAGTGTGNDLIVGGSGSDTIQANAGNDTIRGGSGNSTIYGGSGNESISAGSGNDFISAGSGNDFIDGGSGSDTIQGGSGSDTIHGGAAGHNLIYGGVGGHNLIYGGGPGDTIYGGAGGYDTIYGGSASDPASNTNNQIWGGAGGHNLIFGSGGGDMLSAGIGGNSTIYGGTGAETIYGGDGQALVVNAAGNGLVNAGGDDLSPGNNLLVAGSGNDVIYGDSVAGHNTLQAGAGKDSLYAGIGGDVLEAGSGVDALYGGPGDDTLVLPYFPASQQQPDTLVGGPGANTLVISAMGGVAFPGPGTLTASIDATTTTLTVTDGAAITSSDLSQGYVVQINNEQMLVTTVSGNTLTVQRGYHNTTAASHNANALVLPVPKPPSASNYKIYLTPVAGTTNQYKATLSDLTTSALLGQVTFSLPPETTNLELDGGPGNNWIQVDPAVTQNVILYGGAGNNTLMAGSGSDTLVAGPGSSVLYGGTGDDVLYGGNIPGQDVPTGGATGTTTFAAGSGFVQAIGTANNTTITNLNINTSQLNVGEFIYGTGIVTGTTIVQINSSNSITISLPVQVNANTVENLFFGGREGHDTLIAGPGNDELFAGNGGDVLIGGSVLRQTEANGAPGLAQLSSTDDYVLTAGAGRDILEGGAGNDLLIAGPGSPGEILTAGTGNDTLVSENNGDNVLQGGPGNDLLLGGNGNDVLISGSVASTGNTLVGGLGLDTLLGAAGGDVLYAYPDAASWTQIEQAALAAKVILTPPGLSVPGATSLEQQVAQLLQKQQTQSNGLNSADLSTLSSDLGQELTQLGVTNPTLSGSQIASQLQPQNLSTLSTAQLKTLVSALDEAPVIQEELQGILTNIQDTQPQGHGLTIPQQNLLYYMLLDEANQLFGQAQELQNQIDALPPAPERTPAQQAQAFFLGNTDKQVLSELSTVNSELTGTLVDSLVGGSGKDQLYGSPYYPTYLAGGTGSDTFYNYHTGDTVQGGSAGDNTLVVEGDGTIGLDTAQGSNGVDVTIGSQEKGNVSHGSSLITGLADTSQLAIGESVTGAGIPTGTIIAEINSATQISISNNATATAAAESLTFAAPSVTIGNGVGGISNIQVFEVETLKGNDTVNVDLTTLPSGVTGLMVQAGSGNDVIDASQLQNAATLLGGSGNDTMRIGTQLASNSVYNGGTGQSELDIVGPTVSSQSMKVVVSNGILTVNGVPAKLSNFDKVVMIGGAGINTFTSDGTTVNNATGGATTVVMEGGSGTNTFNAENGAVDMVGGSGLNYFNLSMPTGSGDLAGLYSVTGGTGFNALGVFGDNNGDTMQLSQIALIPFADTANAAPYRLPIHVSAYVTNGSGNAYIDANIVNLGQNSNIFAQGGSGNDILDASAMLMGIALDGYSGNDTLIGGAGNNYLYYTGSGSSYNGGTGLQLYYDGGVYGSSHEAGSTQNTLVFPGAIPSNFGAPPNIQSYQGVDNTGKTYTEPANPSGIVSAGTINVQQGAGPIVALIANFTDAYRDLGANVSINWGDGTTTAGNVSRATPSSPFVVSNNHIYATNGTHAVTVTLIDPYAGYASSSTAFTGGLQLVNGDLRYYNGSNYTVLATSVQSFGVRNADSNSILPYGSSTPKSVTPDVAVFYLLNNGELDRTDATDTSELSASAFQTMLLDPYGGLFALDKSGNLYFNYPFSGQLTSDDTGVQAILEDASGTIYRWMSNGTLYALAPGAFYTDINNVQRPSWGEISPPTASFDHATAISLRADGSTLYVRDANGQYWQYNELSALDYIGSNDGWSYLGGLHLSLSVPANATAGQPVSVTVNALDYFNHPVAAGTPIKVHFTSSDVVAGAPADLSFSGSSDAFNYTFDTAGNQTLIASLVNGSTILQTGSALANVAVAAGQTVNLMAHVQEATPGRLQSLMLLPPPNTDISGTPLALTVTAYDAFGNIATDYTGTVQIAYGSGGGAGKVHYTFTSTDAGVHTFYATLNTPGAQSITVSDASNPQLASVSPAVVVVNPATQLLVSLQPPTSLTAGQTFGLSIEAVDALGDLNPTFSGPVTLSLDKNAGGTLDGTLTVNAVNGVATFSGLTLDKAGIGYTLQATSNGLTTTTTGAFTVTAAPAIKLAVTTPPPGTVVVNNDFGVTVAAEDAFGNVAPTFNGTVTLALQNNPGAATLGGTLASHAVNGVAVFSGLTLNQAGVGYTLRATASGLTAATTGAFSAAGAATQLVVTTQPPSSVGINQPFTLTVFAEDALGTVNPTFNGGVTIAVQNNPGGAALGGTLTVNAVNGVATFSGLTLNQPGAGYTLHVSAGGLTGTTTAAITVFAPPPPPPAPPPHPAPPDVPPLLALLNSLLGEVETVNAAGTTIVDSLFGIALLVETYNYSGNLVSVTLFGINITFLFV